MVWHCCNIYDLAADELQIVQLEHKRPVPPSSESPCLWNDPSTKTETFWPSKILDYSFIMGLLVHIVLTSLPSQIHWMLQCHLIMVEAFCSNLKESSTPWLQTIGLESKSWWSRAGNLRFAKSVHIVAIPPPPHPHLDRQQTLDLTLRSGLSFEWLAKPLKEHLCG